MKFEVQCMKRLLWLAGPFLVTLCGCGKFFVPQNTTGTTTTNTNAGDVLYVANGAAGAQNIDAFAVSSAGTLSTVSGSPYSLGVAPTSMAITTGNTFLYVGTANGIFGYSIGSNGVLTELNSNTALATDVLAPTAMVVDTTGNYLFAAGFDLANSSLEVGVYQIDTSAGTLTALSGSPLGVNNGNGSTSSAPTQLYMTPNNSYLYLTLGSAGTEVLNFTESTGNLSDTGSYIKLSTNGSAQNYAVANSASTVLYVSEIGAGIRAMSIGTDGVPTDISGSPFAAGTGPSGMVLNAAGTALYVADKGGNEISGFSIATNGALTALGSSPYAAGTQPLSMTLDSTGDFLAVANSQGSPDMGFYKFDATTAGKLDALTPPSYTSTAAGSFLVISTHPSS